MLNKIAIISAFIVLMLVIRLLKKDTIHFKSWWISSIVSVIVTIIAIVISMFL